MLRRKCNLTACVLVMMVLFLAAWGVTDKVSGLEVSRAAVTTQHSFGAFWQAGNGRSTELILKNRDRSNPLTANIVLFSLAGEPEATTQFQVAANSVGRLALGSLVKDQPGGRRGGIAVEFAGSTVEPVGRVQISDSRTGSKFDLALQGGNQFDTENTLQATWWLPNAKCDGTVTLFNASGQNILVSPSIATGGNQQAFNKINLGPHQTKELQLRDLLPKASSAAGPLAGSVTLSYVGPAHALQPALLLEDPRTGFSLTPSFNAKHSQSTDQSTTLIFPNLSITSQDSVLQGNSELKALVLMTNGTGSPLTPQLVVRFEGPSGNQVQSLPLPITALASSETRLVDLSQLMLGSIPTSASRFSLSATFKGIPGDLGVSVLSMDVTQSLAIKSDGAVLPGGTIEISYWDANKNVGVFPRVANGSAEILQSRATLYFATSFGVESYVLPVLEIAGKQNQILNLKQIIRSHIPDENGNTVPGATASGILVLAVEDSNIKGHRQNITAECNTECETMIAAVAPQSTIADGTIHIASPLAPAAACTSACPTTITVGPATTMPLTNMFPGIKTGIGAVFRMDVGPGPSNYDGTQITEAVSTVQGQTTCPTSYGVGCKGSSTFTIGTGGQSVDGENFSPVSQSFYDQHIYPKPNSMLDSIPVTGNTCKFVCAQTYSCNGNPVASFTITKTLTKGTLSKGTLTNVPVTNVSVTKTHN